jgi:hypothetical protein
LLLTAGLLTAKAKRQLLGRCLDLGDRLLALARRWLYIAAAIGLRLLIARHFAIRAIAVRLTLLMQGQLRLRRHDQAIIMLGMLKIVLRLNAIAAGMSVTRQLKILFIDMGGRSPNFDVRTVRIHRPAQDILGPMLVLMLLVMLAAAAATTMPAAATLAVLLILSWSHEHRFLALIQSL